MPTYYLSPTGLDANDGSIGSPWLTLETSWNKMSPGDTLYCRGGVYTGNYSINTGVSGTSGNPITIAAYPGETPIFDGGKTNNIFMVMEGKEYVIIDGLTIRYYYGAASAIWIGYLEPPGTNPVDGNIVRNCHIYDIGQTATNQYHGIYISYGNSGTQIYNNVIHGIRGGCGIHFFHTPGSTNVKVFNNLVFDVTDRALVVRNATNVEVYNNTLIHTDAADFDVTSAATGSFRNNILASQLSGSAPATSSNNLFIGVAPDDGGAGSFNGQPDFVNPAAWDYHLSATSDAIAAGTTVAHLVKTDLDGRARTTPYDIGCYQYAAPKFQMFNIAKEKLIRGTIDIDTHSFKVMLVGSAQALTTAFAGGSGNCVRADLTAEITGAGYVAGGDVVAIEVLRIGSAVTVRSDPPLWTSATIQGAEYAVWYDDTAASDDLLGFVQIGAGSTTSAKGGSFSVDVKPHLFRLT